MTSLHCHCTKDMNTIGFLSLSLFFNLSSSEILYFLKHGKRHSEKMDDGLIFNEEDKISKVVIDMEVLSFVKSVTRNDPGVGGGGIIKNVSVIYISDTKRFQFECTLTNDGPEMEYECRRISRLVIIIGKNIQGSFAVNKEETGLESYVGCYKDGDVSAEPNEVTVTKSSDCYEACSETTYYAITGDKKCYCFNNTMELVPADIDFCGTVCESESFRLCGGQNYMSLYAKEFELIHKDRRLYQSSFHCIYSEINCHVCQPGRRSFNCEVIACAENNGNCGNKVCLTFTHMRYASVSVCMCKDGTYFDNNFICSTDETATRIKDVFGSRELYYVAYVSAIFGIIGVYCSIKLMIKSFRRPSPISSLSS